MVTQRLLVSMGDIETNPNLGTVVGYGSPLQGGCLEGFDFLGLHHNLIKESTMKVMKRKPRKCRKRMGV